VSGPAVIRPVPAGRGEDVPVTTRSRLPRARPADLEPDADGFVLLPGGLRRGSDGRPGQRSPERICASAGRPGRRMSLQVFRRSRGPA
jgi:hypothetical protein